MPKIRHGRHARSPSAGGRTCRDPPLASDMYTTHHKQNEQSCWNFSAVRASRNMFLFWKKKMESERVCVLQIVTNYMAISWPSTKHWEMFGSSWQDWSLRLKGEWWHSNQDETETNMFPSLSLEGKKYQVNPSKPCRGASKNSPRKGSEIEEGKVFPCSPP